MERSWAQRKGARRKFNAENRVVTQFAITVGRGYRRAVSASFRRSQLARTLAPPNGHCRKSVARTDFAGMLQHELATGRFAGDCGFGRWIVFYGDSFAGANSVLHATRIAVVRCTDNPRRKSSIVFHARKGERPEVVG